MKSQNNFDIGWTIFAMLVIFVLGVYFYIKYLDLLCLTISVFAGSTCAVWVKVLWARRKGLNSD